MMNRPLRRVAIFTIFCSMIAYTSAVHAVPVFYLSTQSTGATPGLLDLTGPSAVAPNSTGTLHIWADSDVRLSGVSLDLIETGGAIKFTGADWPNPSERWSIVTDPIVADSSVTDLAGGAIPLVAGNGIGIGSPEGQHALLASINYTALATPGATSQLSLRVGRLIVADWEGNAPLVRFGTVSAPDVPGGVPGGMGAVGTITVAGEPSVVPPVVVDLNLGDREQGSVIDHAFTTSAGVPPITWGSLNASGPGPLANAPSLSTTGAFSWNSTGSPLGLYNFDVTATNAFGSDVGRLSLNLVGPAPQPPVVDDFFAGGDPGDTILHTFQASAGDTPITWSNLVSVGTGTPAILPQLTADGMFSWDSTGSPANEYIFRVTATNTLGSDTAELIIGLGIDPRIPEPTTAPLAGLALLPLLVLTRRR